MYASVYSIPGATCTVAHDILEVFYTEWHARISKKRKSYRISGQASTYVSSVFSNGMFHVFLNGKFL